MRTFKKARGFSTVEIVIAIAAVILLGLSGWWVWHSKQDANDQSIDKPVTSGKLSAQQVADTLNNVPEAESANNTNPTPAADDPNSETNKQPTPAATSVYWHPKFGNFTFKYQSDWKRTVWSDDSSSSAITVYVADTGIPLSAGAPVVAPTSNCSGDAPKMYIHSVKEVDVHGSLHTWLITYSYTVNGDSIKGAAFTDWGASDRDSYTAPTVGQTDKCAYQPTFRYDGYQGTPHIWFKMDMPDKYRKMPADEFFALPEVKTALNVMGTGTYIYYGLPGF